MKTAEFHPEDPRLTAFVLGELPEHEAQQVWRAVEADPALQRAVAELEDTRRVLTDALPAATRTLRPDQRDAILRAARAADAADKVTPIFPAGKALKVCFATLAAAAAITLAVLVFTRPPGGGDHSAGTPAAPKADEIPLELALLPAPGPPDAGEPVEPRVHLAAGAADLAKVAAARSSAMEQKGELFMQKVAERITNSPVPKDSDFPQLRPRGEVAALSQPSLPLPVQAGVSSLIWITRTVREENKLPSVNAVRVEEILNHFSLRPAGATAIAQGASISAETTSCPWKPSAVLLLVSFRGANDTALDVAASYVANPANVRRYRLLGFAPVSDLDSGPMPTRLPAKTITSLVIEIEPATPAGDLGSLEWKVNGKAAPPLPLVRNGEDEPSDDARFAALVCTYAQWLINQPAGMIDKPMLAALARETSSTMLLEDRLDFLNLIEQSLRL